MVATPEVGRRMKRSATVLKESTQGEITMKKRKLGNSRVVRALVDASSKIKLEGARYPKFHQQLVGR